jgi:hypothetical protein
MGDVLDGVIDAHAGEDAADDCGEGRELRGEDRVNAKAVEDADRDGDEPGDEEAAGLAVGEDEEEREEGDGGEDAGDHVVADRAFAGGGDGVGAGDVELQVVGVGLLGEARDGGGHGLGGFEVAGGFLTADANEDAVAVGGDEGLAVLVGLEGAAAHEAVHDELVEAQGVLDELLGHGGGGGAGHGEHGLVALELFFHLLAREALAGGVEGGAVEVVEAVGDEDFLEVVHDLCAGLVVDGVAEGLGFGGVFDGLVEALGEGEEGLGVGGFAGRFGEGGEDEELFGGGELVEDADGGFHGRVVPGHHALEGRVGVDARDGEDRERDGDDADRQREEGMPCGPGGEVGHGSFSARRGATKAWAGSSGLTSTSWSSISTVPLSLTAVSLVGQTTWPYCW